VSPPLTSIARNSSRLTLVIQTGFTTAPTIAFTLDCASPLEAELISDALWKRFSKRQAELRAEAYELGWKAAKAKRRKVVPTYGGLP
jgi:hypothetical protein